ncbi:MAG TPA: hypothetical protein VFE25_00165 [Opitutaceae bacterium]|nr:hypothetical protein [Opitutaceae bacterium]
MGTNGCILSSKDGITWTSQSSGTTSWLLGATYGGGKYVVVGDNGCVLISPNGIIWINPNQSATTARLNNVTYGNGRYVAVGEGGAVISSADGLKWELGNSGLTGWLRGLAFVRGFDYATDYGSVVFTPGSIPDRFEAAGQGGIIITSVDGISWTRDTRTYDFYNGLFANDIEALMPEGPYNSSAWRDDISVGSAGSVENSFWYQWLSHAGAVTPTEYNNITAVPNPVELRAVAQGGGRLFVAGENGTIFENSEAYRAEGAALTDWTQIDSGTSANLVAATSVGDAVFIVGDGETILSYTPPAASRLTNISCRAQVGLGAASLNAGFVVGGRGTSGSLPVLIRASGPALAAFGVPDFLPDPYLRLYWRGVGADYVTGNAAWGGGSLMLEEASAVGAFPWVNASSLDSALALTVSSGPYAATIETTTGDSGVALAEIYDALPAASVTPSSSRLINISARAVVGGGADALIAGFVIAGTDPKTVLIRASGPALTKLGVPGSLADPVLNVYSTVHSETPIVTGTNWTADQGLANASTWVGAFDWGNEPTLDAAVLITLPPGSYTANVTAASGDSGIALIEVYEVD